MLSTQKSQPDLQLGPGMVFLVGGIGIAASSDEVLSGRREEQRVRFPTNRGVNNYCKQCQPKPNRQALVRHQTPKISVL